VRKLIGTQTHENEKRAAAMGGNTLGNTVARQAPNGVIHVVATMTSPCLAYELNEEWILQGEGRHRSEKELRANSATAIRNVRHYVESDSQGKVTMRYEGGIGDDGRFLYHGKSLWYYPDGRIQREACYDLGELVDTESFRNQDGAIRWTREHRGDAMIYTTYWSDGKPRSVSQWENHHAEGKAVLYDPKGNDIYSVEFEHGIPIRETGDPGGH